MKLSELTAEETLKWIGENYRNKDWISCFGKNYGMDEVIDIFGASEVAVKIEQWKTRHEKKRRLKQWISAALLKFCRMDVSAVCMRRTSNQTRNCHMVASGLLWRKYSSGTVWSMWVNLSRCMRL